MFIPTFQAVIDTLWHIPEEPETDVALADFAAYIGKRSYEGEEKIALGILPDDTLHMQAAFALLEPFGVRFWKLQIGEETAIVYAGVL